MTFIVFIALFFAQTLSIRSSQFNLLSKVIPRNWVLFLLVMIWFLSAISIYSSFLSLLNIIFTILLVENIGFLSTAYASNLLITEFLTLWFLAVMYNARSSTNNDQSIPFYSSSKISLNAIRKRVTLCIHPVEFQSLFVCSSILFLLI